MTKEEFLDKKNIQLIKEVKTALDLNSEIDVLTYYLDRKTKENPHLLCSLVKRKVKGVYPKYWVHDVFVQLIEMLDKEELILNHKQ